MLGWLENLGSLSDPVHKVEWSGQQLKDHVLARVLDLKKLGLGRGDRILITHGNSARFFVDLLASWELGSCVIPIDPNSHSFEIERFAEHAKARAVIAQDSTSLTHRPRTSDEGLALFLYTSGSTGDPKGVAHTFESISSRLSALRAHVDLDELERTLCLLPTHFGHGLITNSLYPLLHGRSLVILPAFSFEQIAQLGTMIDKHKISFMSSVPAAWEMALQYSPRPTSETLRRVHVASAPFATGTWKQVMEWCGTENVRNVYGLTETASWISGTDSGKESVLPGCVGKSWGAEIRIEEDEVLIKTSSMMAGYLDRPDLTSQIISNGWLKSGDLGSIDQAGNLVLLGRKKDLINKAGVKIYPEELDLLLRKHESILDACTFAVPDRVSGETVGAAIVARKGAQLDFSELESWCRDRIVKTKVPSKWFELPEIPKSSRGKVSRAQVAKICLGDKDDGSGKV